MFEILERVHLGGLVTEVVLENNDGTCLVEATDKDAGLVMSMSTPTDLPDGAYGIGDIPKLLTMYSTGDVTSSLTKKKLIIKSPMGGVAKTDLIDLDMVASKPPLADENDTVEKYFNRVYSSPVEFVLSGDVYGAIKKWFYAVAKDYVVFKVKGGKVKLSNPKTQSFEYNIPIGEVDSDADFSIMVSLKYIVEITKRIDWVIDVVTIRLEDELPVHIQQATSNWYLLPVGE